VLFSSVVSLAYFGGGGGQTAAAAALASSIAASFTPAAADTAVLTSSIQPALAALFALPSLTALLLTPYAFLSFNWATSVEGLYREDIVQAVLRERRARRFRSTLSSLTALCAAVEDMLAAEPGTKASLDRPSRSADDVDSAWALLKETRSPELLNDVYALFSSYDDGSGGLDIEEMRVVVSSLSYQLSDAQLTSLFRYMDIDGGGSVSYKEFVTAVLLPRQSQHATSAPSLDLQRIFTFFDSDGSGEIDEDEMNEKLLGLGFDTEGVEQLFAEIAGPRKRVEERTINEEAFARYLEAFSA